jgi:hypothetical protein
MATFAEVQARLLRTINRPSSETDIVAEVKAFINDAILILQRDHAYSYTEGMFTFDYPADALFADIGEVCDASVRDYISIQQISPSGTYEGKPLQMKSYSQLQQDRRKYSRSHSIDSAQTYSENQIGLTVEDGYREDMIAFIVSKYMGLYPRPGQNTSFLLHVHFWLPPLVEDEDSNFFLDYAEDLVVMLALRRMHLSMKIDSRWQVTDAEINAAIAGLHAWDSQVTQYPGISIE